MNHSQEPWTYDVERNSILDANDHHVCTVHGVMKLRPEDHANGHRIASLSAENARLREALEKIANGTLWSSEMEDAARSALRPAAKGGGL